MSAKSNWAIRLLATSTSSIEDAARGGSLDWLEWRNLCRLACALAAAMILFNGCATPPLSDLPHLGPGAEAVEVKEALKGYEKAHRFEFNGQHAALTGLEWNRGGSPFVWLHGTYSSAYEFAVIAERLSKLGYHVVSVEYTGHGLTPLHDGPLSIEEIADDVALLLRKRARGPAIVGGWSRGAAITATLYERNPDLTRALVLLDGGSWSLAEHTRSLGEPAIREWLAAFHDMTTGKPRFPTFASEDALLVHGRTVRNDTELSRRECLLRDFAALARSERNDEGAWTWLKPSLLRHLGQDTFASTLRGFMHPEDAPLLLRSTSLQDPGRVFKTLDKPVLVFDPGADILDASLQNRRLQSAHPEHVRIVSYPDLGHDVLSAAPLRFLGDLSAFLHREDLLPSK